MIRLISKEVQRKRETGFSIIELLVVMTIIVIMSSVVMVSLSLSRAKARSARQKTDLKLTALALQSYYIDNSSYPTTGGVWYSSESGDTYSDNGGNYIPGLAPVYMDALPRSRGGPATCGVGSKNAYLYRSDGINYKLLMNCGPDGTWTSSDEFYDPVRTTWAWAICSNSSTCATW